MQFTIVESQEREGMKYKVTESGTAYHIDTPDHLVEKLERLRENQTRIVVDYGDVKTGISWNEEHDTRGRIGRSTGRIKIPLLIYSSRSWGGGGLLDNCILSIKHSNKSEGGVIYEAPVKRLEYLRGEIEQERISYGEIAELQSLAQYIEDDDVVLLEWAGVPEGSR